jgi:hypothetical protein
MLEDPGKDGKNKNTLSFKETDLNFMKKITLSVIISKHTNHRFL